MGKIYRRVKWICQKISRGYSDEDLFSLDDTISRFILPRLKAFRECPGGYNDRCFKNIEEWIACIDEMIRALHNYFPKRYNLYIPLFYHIPIFIQPHQL